MKALKKKQTDEDRARRRAEEASDRARLAARRERERAEKAKRRAARRASRMQAMAAIANLDEIDREPKAEAEEEDNAVPNAFPDGRSADLAELQVRWLQSQLKQRRVAEGRLLGLMDRDRSGFVTPKEFMSGLASVDIHITMQQCRRLFNAIDDNTDMRLSVAEIKAMLKPKQPACTLACPRCAMCERVRGVSVRGCERVSA